MKVKIVSERVVADVGSEHGAKRRVVLTRKSRTYSHEVKDSYGMVESVSYNEVVGPREVRVNGLPFTAQISSKDENLPVEALIGIGVDKIKADLQKALYDLEEITD